MERETLTTEKLTNLRLYNIQPTSLMCVRVSCRAVSWVCVCIYDFPVRLYCHVIHGASLVSLFIRSMNCIYWAPTHTWSHLFRMCKWRLNGNGLNWCGKINSIFRGKGVSDIRETATGMPTLASTYTKNHDGTIDSRFHTKLLRARHWICSTMLILHIFVSYFWILVQRSLRFTQSNIRNWALEPIRNRRKRKSNFDSIVESNFVRS